MVAVTRRGWRLGVAVVLAALVMVLGVMAAGASEHLFPAQNEGACDAVGGTFSQDANVRTCVVEDVEVNTVPGGSPGWEIDVETATVTTYTRIGSDLSTDVEEGDPVRVECRNPSGNVMSLNHQHCQL